MAGNGPVRALGRLASAEPWVGIRSDPDTHRLVFGLPDGSIVADPAVEPADRTAGLVAAAIAYFLAALSDPPPELEATHEDVAAAVRALAEGMDGPSRGAAQKAVDAIDDGIHADAVAILLQRLLPSEADAVAILRARMADLPAGPA